MKWAGLAAVIVGVWLVNIAWHDPVEGRYIRPFGAFLAIVGVFVIVLGVRNDIVKAIRERDQPPGGR